MHKARFPLSTGIILGIFAAAYMIFLSPFDIGTDFQAYYFAVKAFVSGENIYMAAPPSHSDHHFIYLPATLLWFLPFALFPEWWQAYALILSVSITTSIYFGITLIRVISGLDIPLSRVDKILIGSFLFSSTFAIPNLLQGQVNLLLGVALGTGLIKQLNGQSRQAGLLVGLAATLKIFPTVIGIWFLYKRDWEALGVAIITGVVHIGLSFVVFGIQTTLTFFTEILLGRFSNGRGGRIAPDVSMVTIRRPLSAIVGLEGTAVSIFALLVGALVVVCVFWLTDDALIQVFVLVITTLVAFPSNFIYLPIVVFPLIPLLYLYGDWLLIAGASFLTATFSLDQLEVVVNLLPEIIANLLMRLATPVFTAATPPLIGYGLLILWVGYQIRYQDSEN